MRHNRDFMILWGGQVASLLGSEGVAPDERI